MKIIKRSGKEVAFDGNKIIAAINEMNIEVVSSLPTEDIDTHTIYFARI